MKPAKFDYVSPSSLEGAVAALVDAGGDGKAMAGGQSLMPLLNFRMSRPSVVVDLTKIPGLSFIRDNGATVSIGALTRHVELETSEVVARKLPVMAAAMRHVAHLAIRNRGTIGGSISHADPAAELPMLAMLHGASIKIIGANGRRVVAAEDFFIAALTTCLEPDEIVYEIEFPVHAASGWGFKEVARRFGDFALACIALSFESQNDTISGARVAAMGIDDTPKRLIGGEKALIGGRRDAATTSRFVDTIRAEVSPPSDQHASSEYRRNLIGTLAEQALVDAWARAAGERS